LCEIGGLVLKAINLVCQSEGSMFQRHCEEMLRTRA
jgi:hypothetical protein